MSNQCKLCQKIIDLTDLTSPYVIRTCISCGRKIPMREYASNGHGIKTEKGDEIIIPANSLQISVNPLKSSTRLTKYGLNWFAKQVFIEDLNHNAADINNIIERNIEYCDEVLKSSELLKGVDIDNSANSQKIFETVEKEQNSIEWWTLLFGTFNSLALQALEENDSGKAAWAMHYAERCRAMCVFKINFEEVVWMGHSAGTIVNTLNKWKANKTNSNEEFWQTVFNENPYLLSQLFSAPVVFIKDKAQIGGVNIDGKNAKYVDYLYSNELSRDAILVEIKTPATKLLGKKYRGIYTPSSEITGAGIQVLDYKRDLSKNIRRLTEDTEYNIDVFNPRCIVIAGNSTTELDTKVKRKSFELFRTNLKDVEIITFDELFKKAESLVTLFNLTWKEK